MGDRLDMKVRRVKPEIGNTEKVIAFFEEQMREAGAPNEVICRINVAADEIFSNIVRYSGAVHAAVGCQIDGRKAILRFEDDGKPFDPTQMPEPDIAAPAAGRKPGGLGIFIVRALTDHVEYRFSGGVNILVLEKEW